MKDKGKTKEQLINELVKMRQRVADLEKSQSKQKTSVDISVLGEEWYQLLFSNVSDAVFVHWGPDETDMPGTFIEVNEVACNKLGYTREELLQMRPSDIDAPETISNVPVMMNRLLKDKQALWEGMHVSKDRQRIPVEIHNRLFDSGGRKLILSTVRDITERKKTEEELKESENNFRRIFDQSPMATAISIDGHFTRVNKAMCCMLGYTEEEFASLRFADITHPDHLDTDMEEVKRLISGEIEEYVTEKKYLRKDGSILWGQLSLRAIRDASGHFLYSLPMVVDITERKRTEEALRESEEKYRSLATTADSMYLVDRGCRYLFLNEGHLSRFKLPLDGIIGRPYSEFHSAESTKEFVEKVNYVFENGRSIQHEHRSERDGRYFLRTFSPVRSPDGKATTAVTVISKDVTERKEAEEARRASEERYQQLVRFAPTAIYEVDFLQMKFTSFNDAMSDYTGYSKEELMSMNPLEILADESKRLFVERLSKHLSGEKISETVTFKIRKKDGQEFWALLNIRLIDENGRPRGAHVVAQDISERIRAEEALRQSEEKYRAIIENMEEGYIELDLTGRITFFNEASQKFLGYSKEEMMGMHYKEYAYEDNSQRIFRIYNEVYRTRVTQGPFEWEVIRKDGTRRIVEGSASLISDAEGRPVGFRGLFRDITARKRLQEEHERLQERLHRAEKMEALGTLAGGVAHDLNNVLGVLVGYSELLLRNVSQDNPLRRHAMQILKGGERAAAIIQDLLTLTRRGVVVSDIVNLNRIISEFLQTPEFEAIKTHHPDVQFKISLDAELLNVKGSPTHLGKTLMNLLSNGAEAITGLGEVVITTKNRYVEKQIHGYDSTQEGEYAVLTVSDTGSGISSADIGKIFEPFYTKKVMGRSGTGLGLAVVWGTVKDHSGYIDVQSVEGKGTIFTLYFPVTREAMTTVEEVVPQSTYMGRGEHILVVDDVEGQRILASAMMESLGYKVDSATSGEEAVKFVQNKPVDLLILDMIMDPGIDGLETYRRIRQISKDQKAIIVSGFAMTERVRQTQELGAGAYVKKPYLLEKIGLAVRKELDRI